MSEKIHTPSDIFSESSQAAEKRWDRSSDKGKLDILSSEKGAYAAKPFMDVAVDIFDAVGDADAALGLDRNDVDITDRIDGFQDLVNFAEQRAHKATKNNKVPELSVGEERVLDVFRAEAEMRHAAAKADMFTITDPDSLGVAIDEAYERKAKGGERSRWTKMEQKVARYQEYLSGDYDDEVGLKLKQEFSTTTGNAGRLLKVAKGGEITPGKLKGQRIEDITEDARFLRQQAEMFNFLAEIHPADTGQEVKPQAQPKTKESDQTPERQTSPEQAILNDVLAASKNNVIIHTDAPSKVALRIGDRHVDLGGKGFSNFGSRAGSETAQHEGILAGGFGTPESVQFQRTKTEQVFEQREQSLGRFKGTTMRNVYVGNKQVAMPDVINPKTGQQEPGVVFRYRFSGQSIGDEYPANAPAYATNGGRPGNQLEVETTLPQSTANELEQMIRENPKLVRELAHKLVTTEGDVPEDIWQGTRANSSSHSPNKTVAAMCPPYEQLPNDWQIALWGDTTLKGNSELYTNLPVNES